MVVAIDGPAGTGKSTVAKRISQSTKFQYVNSGSLYRAITLLALEADLKPDSNNEEIAAIATAADIDYIDGETRIDSKPVEALLRTDIIDANVAQISSIPPVRKVVNKILQKIAGHTDIVVEGRDMCTVVFPDAAIKIYLDASIEARAQRRFEQGTSSLSLEEITASIARRDTIDRSKSEGALRKAEDAVYLDTSHLTIEAVCVRVLELIQRHI
ncbi:(d)CMP kinase [Spirochaeta dissipatitropha]